MVFIKILNKFCITIKNMKNIQFINLIYNWQLANNFIISYLFYINKLVRKKNENVLINTLSFTFIFRTMDINYQSCSPSYKLSNDSIKTICLHFTIHIKKYMLVKLCANNYAMYDDFGNKTSTTYCDKTIIWIMFKNFKIGH